MMRNAVAHAEYDERDQRPENRPYQLTDYVVGSTPKWLEEDWITMIHGKLCLFCPRYLTAEFR